MNKLKLKQTIAAYLHRDDLGQQLDGFVDMATNRIGRDLEGDTNTVQEIVPITNGIGAVPITFRKTLAAVQNDCFLQSLPARKLQTYQTYAGQPAFYSILSNQIYIAPKYTGDIVLIGYTDPAALIDDTSSNSTLVAYPQLYLYACLMEAFFYTQESKGHDMAQAQYEREIRKINTAASEKRIGANPAMRA